MKKLVEDLKNRTFEKVYLLYGDEDYLRGYWYGKLKEALATGDSMNVRFMDADTITPEDAKDFTDTMPFFADRRVLFVTDSGIFASSSDAYADWLSALPDTACVVFSESHVDKRNRAFKKAAEAGHAVDLSRPSEADFNKWVLRKIGAAKLNISRSAFDHLLEVLDRDMTAAQNELDKLCAYAQGQEAITVKDIDTVMTVHLESRVFDLVEAVARGNRRRSMELYYDMLALHEAPLRILFFIGRQFRQMMTAATMYESRVSNAEITSVMHLSDYVVKKLLSQSARFSLEEIRLFMERCAELETAVKTGDLQDVLAVELFIFEATERKK